MKEKILELRSIGKSYREIVKTLGCSKGTIAYHCGPGQRKKSQIRYKIYKDSLEHIVKTKIDNFISRVSINNFEYIKRSPLNKLYYDKILRNPICYLTGRKINLEEKSTYCLDHIIPYSISKNNTVDNMGLACKDVNFSKSYLTVDQYLALCKEVLEYNGYTVVK